VRSEAYEGEPFTPHFYNALTKVAATTIWTPKPNSQFHIPRRGKNLILVKMNITYSPIPIPVASLPPAIEQLGHDIIKAAAFLLIPAELLYFSIYFLVKKQYRIYKALTFLSIIFFWASPYAAPIYCGPARCLQNFASMQDSNESD